ncbi:LacI family DNA-binding transcriptional regulator [Streptomyces sp. TLI_171]|uniref:LacI family DNA-binding transcriptional regulator n=1 Tax=Streptomyces sp. TLI_171 TaxID=1938859 RepID=UPI000C5EC2D0|nr:LacI family DNA-binding transcriptional regulator [Streptomyces sp. TLI_171]RKE23019.1 LacI family transcriptional regulator [Streptomyces sp. TLI_171]
MSVPGNIGGAGAPRLKDVAELAGVSVKTVSNVVNGTTPVAEATRERVQRAIDTLGYLPNVTARRLRTGRSGVIALAFPELPSPYFAELAVEVIAAARRVGITVLMDDTGGDPAAELRIASGLGDPMIDGVILSPLGLDRAALLSRSREIPLVLLGEADLGPVADRVHIDNVAGAREVTRHLLDEGYRRIAAIGWQDPAPRATAEQRLAGYREALRDAGLTVDQELLPPVRAYFRPDGASAMRRLLRLPERPDAVFCFNDLLALGALRAAHEAGLRVPQDLAIVGFDDVEEAAYAIPSLTTVAPDKRLIAELAVRCLEERIEQRYTGPGRRITPGFRVVVRESSTLSR